MKSNRQHPATVSRNLDSEWNAPTAQPPSTLTIGGMVQAQSHTPGPWEVIEIFSEDSRLAISQKGRFGWWIATILTDTAEARANARLIAAAPEQNKALINAAGCFGNDEVWWESRADYAAENGLSSYQIREEVITEMRAAIAKAKGRTE